VRIRINPGPYPGTVSNSQLVDWTGLTARFMGNLREYRVNESLTPALPSPIIGQAAAMSTSDAARGALKPHPDRPHDGTGDRSSERASSDRPTKRSALIEQLLLAGLDDYFAGRYEQAIHVWTRVFFLDRGHTRARAYIERARGALAERQREAEAHGLQTDGLERASHARVGSYGSAANLDSPADAHASACQASGANTQPTRNGGPSLRRGREKRLRHAVHTALVVVAAALLFTAGYLVAERDQIAAWWRAETARAVVASEAGRQHMAVEGTTSSAGRQTTAGTDQRATDARGSELALARARQLVAHGRFEEAGRVLDTIADDDPLRRDADALLAEVQRALLDSALKAREPSATAGAPVGSVR
jgi:hypothetical protein